MGTARSTASPRSGFGLRAFAHPTGDIVAEGIALYDAHDKLLARPKAMNDRERLEQGLRNLRYWFGSANGFWRVCGYCMVRGMPAHAAFLLHQAVERYFHALTLVYTGYKHKTHDILWLANHGATLHEALIGAMPRTEAGDKERFDLLRRAYIEARYSKSYRISEEELTTLRAQVRDLAERVRLACGEKLAQFCGPEEVGELPGLPEEGDGVDLPPPPALDDPAAVERWSRAVLVEGKEIGWREGFVEGRTKGKEEGVAEGEARGKEVGSQERAVQIARSLLAEGMATEQVARLTGLSSETVAALADEE